MNFMLILCFENKIYLFEALDLIAFWSTTDVFYLTIRWSIPSLYFAGSCLLLKVIYIFQRKSAKIFKFHGNYIWPRWNIPELENVLLSPEKNNSLRIFINNFEELSLYSPQEAKSCFKVKGEIFGMKVLFNSYFFTMTEIEFHYFL